MTQHAFDPSAARQRQEQLERRLASAVQRIADAKVIERVREPLTTGTAVELFDLLANDDRRIAAAAHECAMLRFAFIVAVVAQSMAFDADRRDDLVQRTFLNLPQVVRRSIVNGVGIPNPEGWLAYRAHLMARQMFREERGSLRREDSRAGRLTFTRGRRVSLDHIDQHMALEPDALSGAADIATTRAELEAALDTLGRERRVWADVLRLHYMEGLRLDEIATRLGRSHGTVRNDALEARKRLLAIVRANHPHLAQRDAV